MRNTEVNNKLLASYALFRELTNNGKHIHDVLSDFLIDIINAKQLFTFNTSEINGYLKDIYEFQIPDAVVKTLLKKLPFLKYELQIFTVIDKQALVEHYINEKEITLDLQNKNNKIIEQLYEYIALKKGSKLTEADKNKILQSFTDFILDKTIDNYYTNDISLFIISNQYDINFINDLQTIKDGVILYTGIKYNQNFDIFAAWKSKMTIYLNTEILFHCANYNGSIFKTLFFDFYNLVKEVNYKKKYIFLKYFRENKEEVEFFFSKAENIVQGFDTLNPSNTAMTTIVNGCNDITDVISKKVRFFNLLERLGILEETEDEEIVFIEENYKYNILSTDTLKEQYGDDNSESTEMYLKILNTINVKRAEKEQYNLEDVGYIFLTENRKVRNIAWSEEIKKQGVVPLSTTLQFLTNKLWFKLNKGFGGKDLPKSFNIITKAQILLSHHIGEQLNKEYYELKKDIGNKGLTEEEVILVLHELRERAKLPEDIVINNIPSIMKTVTTESYEQFIIEKNDIHRTVEEQSKENNKLKVSLDNTNKEKEKLSSEAKKLKEGILKEKEKNLKYLESSKDRINEKIDKRYKRLKIKLFTPLPILYVFLAVGIYFIGWNKIEPMAWILTISLPFILSFIYLYKEEKSFNIMHVLNEKKEIIINEESEIEDFDIKDIQKITKEIDDLQKELVESYGK